MDYRTSSCFLDLPSLPSPTTSPPSSPLLLSRLLLLPAFLPSLLRKCEFIAEVSVIMALFPAAQASVRKDPSSRNDPETMSMYPTADSVKSKQPRAPPSYPPPNPSNPKQAIRRNQPPPTTSIPTTGKVPQSSRKAPAATVETEDEDSMTEGQGRTEFRYAPRPVFENNVDRQNEGQGQMPTRGRRSASQAPINRMQEGESDIDRGIRGQGLGIPPEQPRVRRRASHAAASRLQGGDESEAQDDEMIGEEQRGLKDQYV